MKKIIQVLKSTTGKKVLYLTAIVISLAVIWYFIWSWLKVIKLAINYSILPFILTLKKGHAMHD